MDAGKRDKSFRSGRVAFFLIGLVLASIGSVLTLRTAAFVGRAEKADATVVKVDKSTSHSGGRHSRRTTSYKPTFRFTDAAGREHIVTLGHSSSEYNYAAGSQVAVLYDPQAPDSLCVATFFGTWLLSLIVLGVGVILLAVAFAMHLAVLRATDAAAAVDGRMPTNNPSSP